MANSWHANIVSANQTNILNLRNGGGDYHSLHSQEKIYVHLLIGVLAALDPVVVHRRGPLAESRPRFQ